MICPKCGATIEGGYRYVTCPNCGRTFDSTLFDNVDLSAPNLEPKPDPKPATVSEPMSTLMSETITIPDPQTPIPDSAPTPYPIPTLDQNPVNERKVLAVKYVEDVLNETPVSRAKLVAFLQEEDFGFTKEEAIYGVDHAKDPETGIIPVNWAEQARKFVEAVLEDTPASRIVLINLLQDEDTRFKKEEAIYGVDHAKDPETGIVPVNWAEQARKFVEAVLEDTPVSRIFLINQLQDEDIRFTKEEAIYGVDHAKDPVTGIIPVNWAEQARKFLEAFWDGTPLSRAMLFDYLQDEEVGFTKEEAIYGVDHAKDPETGIVPVNWAEQARKFVEAVLEDTPVSRIFLINLLQDEDIRFTKEEAIYGVDHAKDPVTGIIPVNWAEQAKQAADVLVGEFGSESGISRALCKKALSSSLNEDGFEFTFAESEAALDYLDSSTDWNKQAVVSALSSKEVFNDNGVENPTKDDIKAFLINNYLFTDSQAEYGASHVTDQMLPQLIQRETELVYPDPHVQPAPSGRIDQKDESLLFNETKSEDPANTLLKVKKLLDVGAIDQHEYDILKAEMMRRMIEGVSTPDSLHESASEPVIKPESVDKPVSSNSSDRIAAEEQDERKAFECYLKAADQGDAEAQFNVGECYRLGCGTEVNQKLAFDYYLKSADQGYSMAQLFVGEYFRLGLGTKVNNKKAFEFFKKCADQGNSKAQNQLGYLYETGQGVDQDDKKAFEYYLKASEQGDEVAQCNLGKCYNYGRGTELNYEKAFEYYLKAAEQGYAEAQFNLGECYRLGCGTMENYNTAFEYYKMSAEQGFALAKTALKNYYYG